LHTFMIFVSSKTSSSQSVLGLPIGLLDMGFHLLIFCTLLSLAVRSTWPNQILLLLQSALQPLVGFRPVQLSLSILSRKVLQSAVANGTSNPQLGGEPGI
jgi:hypothetical protein